MYFAVEGSRFSAERFLLLQTETYLHQWAFFYVFVCVVCVCVVCMYVCVCVCICKNEHLSYLHFHDCASVPSMLVLNVILIQALLSFLL